MAVLSPSFPFRMANIPPPTPNRDPKKIVRREPPPRQGPLPVAPGKERQKDPRGKAPEGELVGNYPVVDVDEDDRHEEREENEVAYQREPDAVPPGEQGEPGPGERLHAGIAPGDPVSATRAPASQEKKAYDRDVLRRPDGTSARGATRCRHHDRLLPGETVYEHVEKAPQARAEYEHPGQEQGKKRHLRAPTRTRHLKSFR